MWNFNEINIGERFNCNGMNCTKKSTRTAFIDGEKCELWFYFGSRESVSLGWK